MRPEYQGREAVKFFKVFQPLKAKPPQTLGDPVHFSPSTVRTALPRPSKLPSARFQKPSFRKQRPPDSGPDRPQDRLPTPGGPCPGSLRRNRPVQTAVLCESAPARTRRSIGKRDPPSEGPRRPASRRRSGGRFLRPAGSPLRPGRASARRGSEGTLPPRSSRAPTAR